MIATGFESRVQIQQIVENQLPEFILSESPKLSEFLKQYYISQEFSGGPVDIVDNLDQYLKLDNLTPEVISGFTELSTNISSSVGIITVTTTKGFPPKYGLLKIDDEIITYTGITTNTFTGCVRGFSGITSYHGNDKTGELIFSNSSSSEHVAGKPVHNLSSLFLKEFYKKIKSYLTPGLEDSDFVSNLDVSNFIKQSKSFYQSKGTEESFRILFNILYGVNPKIIDLENYLLKPSYSQYIRREIVIAERISGNPNNLVGQTIKNSTDQNSQASVSEVEIITRKGKTYYKLGLFIGFDEKDLIQGSFSIPGKTKVIGNVSVGSSVITVDSTIGFNTSGKFICGKNIINYNDKTLNQFLDCSGVVFNINSTDTLRSNEFIYGYENGDLTKKVELRITGVLSKFIPTSDINLISEGEKIFIKNLGENITNPESKKSKKQIFSNSWIYNTSSRYKIKSISGSSFVLFSDIDKSSLKESDSVDILISETQNVVVSNAVVKNINKNTNQILLNNLGGFTPSDGLSYDVRRNINKAYSSGVDIQYGNYTITSDIQNLYNDSDAYFYVASNSLPSYPITKNVSRITLIEANQERIQGYNKKTLKYSILSFSEDVPFITGDAIYYSPEITSIPGLNPGVYYIKVLENKNQIRLYSSRSFVISDNYLEFDILPPGSGSHIFTLLGHSNKKLFPQKILKKFPLEPNIKSGYSVETVPGSVGMLINGVEIENYKSNDKIYYGPIKKINILNGGFNYDVINPPSIEVSPPLNGVTCLVQPVVSGIISSVYVDPQSFDIEKIISVTVSGGNGDGAVLEPVLSKRTREILFNAKLITDSGGIDVTNETITFIDNHNLINGQPIVYNKNGNNPIGIGTFLGSNLDQKKTLQSGEVYYAKIVNTTTIKLYETFSDYYVGINTIGFTTTGNSGIHKFRIFETKNTLQSIKVLNSGSGYENRKLIVKPIGISTSDSTVNFINHNFNDGEKIIYSTTGSSISGLNTTNQYYIIKIDENSFRLSDAGVGGTVRTNYQRNKYIKFKSIGSGYHNFEYPPIEVKVSVGYSGTIGTITATPIVRGSIVDAYIYENGSGYGSKVLNILKNVSINIKNGKGAQLNPIITDGRISSVEIQNRGTEYNAPPDLEVIGDGIGAKLRVNVQNGSISEVIILNPGVNYTKNKTTISVKAPGFGSIINAQIRELSINNFERYGSEILVESQNQLKYSVVGYSTDIGKEYFGDSGFVHSPIIGWAYDGNPIYGPYGYDDPSNERSSIRNLKTGYTLSITNIEDRPNEFDSGFFNDDYKFTNSGDLDEHNGRYCKTPEYPDGVYAYFVGISTDILTGKMKPNYPYFVGNTYRSNPIDENFLINQNNFDFNNSNLIRNTFPYKVSDEYADNDFIVESNEYVEQTAVVESVTKGVINSIEIEEPGDGYKVNDSIIFDDTATGGNGLSAFVKTLNGKDITNLNTTVEKYNNVVFLWNNANEVSAYISTSHTLNDGDNITVSGLSTSIKSLTGSHIAGISSINTVVYKEIPPNLTAGIVTDIYISSIPNSLSIGSSIQIGTEKLFVLNTFSDKNILRVKRGLSGSAHTISTYVNLIPSFLTLPIKSNYFESKLNDKYYFNPKESVGIGTVTGISTAVNYSKGELIERISVPTQSIYLPNHKFNTNQQVIFTKPSTSSGLTVSNSSGGPTFTIPTSGNSQVVYIINKSKDYIGIATQIGLTTSTNGLYFVDNGSYEFDYYLESNYTQVTGNIEKAITKVSVSTYHGLQNDDNITLTVKSNRSVGIGTSSSVKIKYNSSKNKILINPVGFSSFSVNLSENKINIPSHNLKTGDKIFYDSNLVSSGLSTGEYFVYRIDDNNIKLSETYYDSTTFPPNIVSLGSTGGSNHQISLINPPISVTNNNNLVFDLSDSSLIGCKLKLFYDNSFNNEFVSTGSTNIFVLSGVGTVGLSENASLSLNYSVDNPVSLYYTLEKSGNIYVPDKDISNYSKITYIESSYNNSYKIFGVNPTYFLISLKEIPEVLVYTKSNTNLLKYSTNSKTATGGINSVQINFGGFGYKKLPNFVSVASTQGINAKILPKSKNISKIDDIRILDPGFEYSSDKTLNPEAFISPILSITNSSEIKNVEVLYGGKNYSTPPDLIVVDSETGKTPLSPGLIQSNLNGTSIINVNIIENPKGLSSKEQLIVAINNDNGIGIEQVNYSPGGIVTCLLSTPVSGFSTSLFYVGEKIFVEGIQKFSTTGDGFNSSDYKYNFFIVSDYRNTIPAEVDFNLSSFTTNPGIAKTVQNSYASIIKYDSYPRFKVIQEQSLFQEGENLLSLKNEKFDEINSIITESGKNYIKVFGKYSFTDNEIIKGSVSKSIAVITNISNNFGKFNVDYSLRKNYGWIDNRGKLNEDYQVLPDNDYYQLLSYSIKSPIEFETLINPVNRLLHTSGLKNFADTEIKSSSIVSFGSTSIDQVSLIDILEEKRVDTINDYDLALDVDIFDNKSKYLKIKNKPLSSYIECKTNRVLKIDDISSKFSNSLFLSSSNNYVDLILDNSDTYSRFLVQIKNIVNTDTQVTELIVFKDSDDIFTFEKSNLYNSTEKLVDIFGNIDEFGVSSLRFSPLDVLNSDYDIKIFKNSFNSILPGISTQSIGFVNLTSVNRDIVAGQTSDIISSSISKINFYFASIEITNNLNGSKNFLEIFINQDGSNSYFSEYYVDSERQSNFSSKYVGIFTSFIESGILYFTYKNNTSDNITLRSKIVGFGSTSAGSDVYRFKNPNQPNNSERSLRLESNYVNTQSTSTIVGFNSSQITSVNNIVRVSYGSTSAVHQVLMFNDTKNIYITQYPFVSIGTTSGIGTFSSKYNGSNFDLVFHPDQSINSNLQIQTFSEIIYTDSDSVNYVPDLTYGSVIESLSLLQFNSINGPRSNKISFDLNYNNIPIFEKKFDPSNSSILNLSTGIFQISNHFFNTGEKLIYTPGSTFLGVNESPVGIGSTLNSAGIVTNILPSEVYAIKINKDQFKISTRKDYSLIGIGVTFTSSGSGNSHKLEMDKKLEKSLINVDGFIQSPLAFTPISTKLNYNNGQINDSSTVFSVSGISSIVPDDILKIDNEYMNVISVGFGTTSIGPLSGIGTFSLLKVERGYVGSSASSHLDGSIIRVYSGSFNIVNNKIYFTNAPRGNAITSKDSSNLDRIRSTFDGRVYLRNDYTNNRIFDDISEKFTGIGQTYTLNIQGINTTGIQTGNGLLLINGIFQSPSTFNNSNNNYSFIENVGVSSFVFTGITSSDGSKIRSLSDVNQNQLPRGGIIISVGSSGGLGIAPLVGASVTAVIGAGGTIVSVGLGSTDILGSGYRQPVSVSIASTTGVGASITAVVGLGGTLSFNVINPGSGYVNPSIYVSEPSYGNLSIRGVSRLGIGTTTETGSGLLLSVKVGASSTTGIGSTLFEVTSFEITRPGYGFKVGDVFTPVGLVTDKRLSSPITNFNLTVLDIFTDNMSFWEFGELDYIDSISDLQDGFRTRFPLRYNGNLLSFKINRNDLESSLIDLNTVLLIFVNGILQSPQNSYVFEGGTSFSFVDPPKPTDEVSIFFYKGTSQIDSFLVTVDETIKSGDSIQLFKNNNYLQSKDQNSRKVYNISASDRIETSLYKDEGIDTINFKPFSWTKTKVDKIINGENTYKTRDSIEPLVYPTSKIIKNFSSEDNELFVDNAQFFKYEQISTGIPIIDFGGLIVADFSPVVAKINPVVSSAGTIQSLSIINSGSGYVGNSVNVSISAPPVIGIGIGTTARVTANIVNGMISSLNITNSGFGYTQSNPPQVLVPSPTFSKEKINNITTVEGFSGIITGITTTNGTYGNSLALKFYLNSTSFVGLRTSYPIYIFNTTVGNGITSIDLNNSSIVGIGTTFLDNIYYIHAIDSNGQNSEIITNIDSNSNIAGINISGSISNPIGNFSWGRLSGFNRSSSPVSIAVSGFTVDSGLSTFPSIQRKDYGLRNTGALKKIL